MKKSIKLVKKIQTSDKKAQTSVNMIQTKKKSQTWLKEMTS